MVRAKFKCTGKTQDEYAHSISLMPVTSSDGGDENKTFYKATPGGKIELNVVNQATADQFEVGKSYYVDFTPADIAEVNIEPGGESN